MSTSSYSVPGNPRDLSPRDATARAAALGKQAPEHTRFNLAALLDAPDAEPALAALSALCQGLQVQLDLRTMPATLARGGTVGRIGVPQEAVAMMRRQRILLAGSHTQVALTPISRLWRGLQRRADVLIDLRQCVPLLAGAVDGAAGLDRDVLLCSHRVHERAARVAEPESADTWRSARESAALAVRIAAAEQRTLVVVTPIGRSTAAQQLVTEAIEREARQQRAPTPRVLTAGLLSALLVSDAGRGRIMAFSVLPVHDLSALVAEAVGEIGAWPVVSVGRDVSFCEMPLAENGHVDTTALALVLVTLLQRTAKSAEAKQLLDAVVLTTRAVARMREELASDFPVSHDAFMAGVLANIGRGPSATVVRAHSTARPVTGVKLRVATSVSSAALRALISSAVSPTGLEVASVRAAEGQREPDGLSVFDVRLRAQLGEAQLTDEAAQALMLALGTAGRCLSTEPWSPAPERSRAS
jgi:hypothetical protein